MAVEAARKKVISGPSPIMGNITGDTVMGSVLQALPLSVELLTVSFALVGVLSRPNSLLRSYCQLKQPWKRCSSGLVSY